MFTVASKLRETSSSNIVGIAGGLNDAESLVAFKDLLHRFNSEQVYTEGDFPKISGGVDLRFLFIFK